MNPFVLALRNVLYRRGRSVAAVLTIGACLCALDLFVGHSASVRARLEFQAVVGERLGHLTIVRRLERGVSQRGGFDQIEARRLRQIVENQGGVMLVMPQMSLNGIASTGHKSSLFIGEGIGLPADLRAAAVLDDAAGKLDPALRNGVALSSGQAQQLGLRSGSSLVLTGITPDGHAQSQDAEVVDIFRPPHRAPHARSLLMPLELAQSLLDTEEVERFVVFLSDPGQLGPQREVLHAALRRGGIETEILTWQDLSATYAQEKRAARLAFGFSSGLVVVVVLASIGLVMSINAIERRREMGVLRALGMRPAGVFLLFALEALWLAAFAVGLGIVATSVVAWVVNRAGISYVAADSLGRAALVVDLDHRRMLVAVLVVLALSVLAALLPALKAARASLADALAR